MVGFGGYLVIGENHLRDTIDSITFVEHCAGLIIGLAYDKITRIIPLFVVLYVDFLQMLDVPAKIPS